MVLQENKEILDRIRKNRREKKNVYIILKKYYTFIIELYLFK
jgi:hypothetical protein